MAGSRFLVSTALALALGGCWQGVDALDEAGDGGTGEGTEDGTGEGAPDDGGPASELPAPTTRFFRLSHEQWENTVRDLFHLDQHTGLSDAFRADPFVSGFIFDNNALALEVDQALWSGYQRAAADAAELAVTDQAIFDAITPPDSGDAAARAREFIETFGKRAYRRPLEDAEVDELVTRFNDASNFYDGSDAFAIGVRYTVETLLQSPHFLYRIELSTAVAGEVIPLDGWEVAQRLSYFLWNTMPDDELLSAAEGGSLLDRDGVEEQARRMLAGADASDVVSRFHHQLLEVEKVASAMPSEAFFPDVPAGFGESAVVENDLFVRDLVLDRDGTFADLMTSTETFVDADLAEIYGLAGTFDDQFVSASLDPTQRRGLFTQIAFLAGHATSVNPDPIHRGVFLAKRITCTSIAAPPDGVPPLPPPDPNKTNRELVEEHTQKDGTVCAGCHSGFINPYGFPYESYDAIGAYRTEDNGFPVDPASDVLIGDEVVHVENALELADALAESTVAHECYMKHWIEFANGRPSAPEDDGIIARLGEDSAADTDSIQDLIVKLVVSQPFRSRATEELP